jgi:hypothetical protein
MYQEKSGNPDCMTVDDEPIISLPKSRAIKKRDTNLSTVQCDQIGRSFAFWAIVYFGQFLYNRSSPNFWTNFLREKKVRINFGKK